MEYDGLPSCNWTTWILLMIWLSCPTPKSRCKKRSILWLNVITRIGKARVAFLQLKNIWKSNVLSLINKIRIFNTNVKAVLLY